MCLDISQTEEKTLHPSVELGFSAGGGGGGKQSWSFCIGDPSALLGHTLRDHDFATPTLIAIGHAKRHTSSSPP